MDTQKVGQAIAYLRKRVGYTQKELADRIGVSDKAVSKWERGLGLPDIGLIGKIAILLDSDTDSLLAGDLVHHNSDWSGLLILEENVHGIGAATVIYDKPLISFLLSYFLLMGIREIRIVCGEADEMYLRTVLGSGQELGLSLSYWPWIPVQEYKDSASNVMIVTGKSLIYGVDQSRFFQKAMLEKERTTILSLPKKKVSSPSRIYYNCDKKVVSAEDGELLKTQYDYYQIPILFCPSRIVQSIRRGGMSSAEAISTAIREEVIYTVVLDRGFVEIPMEDWNQVMDASLFVKTVQKACGMQIYCMEEIAWRRGMISHQRFAELGEKYKDTAYGRYIQEMAGTEERDFCGL